MSRRSGSDDQGCSLEHLDHELSGSFPGSLTALWLCCVQVIQATVEKHKQKSETFRAFSSACSQDEESGLSPDQPVSQQPVVKGKWEVNSWPGREA